MPRTLIGLVYNKATMMARRLEILESNEDDAVLDDIAGRLPAGFALAKVPIASLPAGNSAIIQGKDTTLSAVLAANAANRGPAIVPQARCVEIDLAKNVVTDVYLADVTVWKPPGKLVAAHPTAPIDAVYDPAAKTLTFPQEVDPKTGQRLPQMVVSIDVAAADPAVTDVAVKAG